jgi:hypothetical protein
MRGTRWFAGVLALAAGLPACGWAQGSSDRAFGAAQATSTAEGNDAWLAHVRSLYSSTSRDGLNGFDCTIQPDWRAMIASANSGKVDALGERKIAALNAAQITLHARMDGTSTIDFNAPDPPTDLAGVMKTFSDATKQSMGGFVQFWSPFANETVIPDTSQGVDFAATPDGGRILNISEGGTTVTETFDANDVLTEYDVHMSGVTALFTPTFSPSPKGLRVTKFLAHYQAHGGPDQEMQVWVTYGQVGGYTIPSEVDMTLLGTATFNVALTGCKANP